MNGCENEWEREREWRVKEAIEVENCFVYKYKRVCLASMHFDEKIPFDF